jgi:ferredoxin
MISEKDLKDFTAYAKTLGINGIGFIVAKPSDIFKEKHLLFKNAILLTMEMKADKIVKAPSKTTMKEIFRTYLGLGVSVNKLTQFLKDRGYRAHAGPALGGEANYPLMAERAGLGAIGKHGILITPEFGPSLRLAAVYTEIENLPFSDENPHLWVRDFCDKCNRCVRKCPAGAIYKDAIVFDDGTKQHIDYKKCAVPFSNNHGCTVCVKECLFFSQGYEKIKSSFLAE